MSKICLWNAVLQEYDVIVNRNSYLTKCNALNVCKMWSLCYHYKLSRKYSIQYVPNKHEKDWSFRLRSVLDLHLTEANFFSFSGKSRSAASCLRKPKLLHMSLPLLDLRGLYLIFYILTASYFKKKFLVVFLISKLSHYLFASFQHYFLLRTFFMYVNFLCPIVSQTSLWFPYWRTKRTCLLFRPRTWPVTQYGRLLNKTRVLQLLCD